MGQIFIESKPTPLFWWDHLYLVYRDDNGNETVIRSGPEMPTINDFGQIELQINVPIEQSEDARGEDTAEDRGQVELDLGGWSAEDVWREMQEVAHVWHSNNWSENHQPIVTVNRNEIDSELYCNVKDKKRKIIKQAYAIKKIIWSILRRCRQLIFPVVTIFLLIGKHSQFTMIGCKNVGFVRANGSI